MLKKVNLENCNFKLENNTKGLTLSNFISRGSGGLRLQKICRRALQNFNY
jgi:hypothetical protein